MLPILFFILKILGIILLVLICLVLFLCLVILLVPFRYRADLQKEERPKGELLLSWLFHGVSLKLCYDETAQIQGKVLWFSVFKKQLWPPEGESEEEPAESTEGEPGPAETMMQTESLSQSRETSGQGQGNAEESMREPADSESQRAWQAEGKQTEYGEEGAVREGVRPAKDEQTESGSVEFEPAQTGPKEPEIHAVDLSSGREKERPGFEEPFSDEDRSGDYKPQEDGNRNNKTEQRQKASRGNGRFSRVQTAVRRFFQRITGIPDRIRRLFKEFRNRMKSGRAFFEKAKNFLEKEENQETFRLIVSSGKKLLRHVLPQKLKGRVHFGFSDPYRTGQLLTAVSPFYGLYAKDLELVPDFEHEVLEGELHIKGRIRLGAFVWTGIRLFRNRNFRRLLKKYL